MTKKFFASLVFFLFLGAYAFSYGVLAHPRKVYVLSTNHFDILFSEEDRVLAKYLADNADSFYDKANEQLDTDAVFRIPIVISPDSDILSVEYTSYPYYRMVIFDAVPDAQFADYKTTFDDLFYHEVFSAVAQSMMSPFNQTVKKLIGGDPYNPVSLYNLPFSFVEGFIFANNQDLPLNKFNYRKYIELLSQAKWEKKFPSWFQIFSARDIYPGNDLPVAAGSAFAAYLINTYGIEKYAAFWKECGKIHPFLTFGNFYKVYRVSLDLVWDDFKDSIPLPDNLRQIRDVEKEISRLFLNSESNFEHLVNSKNGLIWYDSVRHEIDIYDFKENSKRKKLLFADNIQRLEVSPDGKYLAISYFAPQSSDNFNKEQVWIYDIENKKKVIDELFITDVTFVQFADDSLGFAGINKADKIANLQIYKLDLDDNNISIYNEIKFANDNIFSSMVSNEKGKLLFNYYINGSVCLCEYNYIENTYKYYQIGSDDLISVENLKLQLLDNKPVVTFEYYLKDKSILSRMGYMSSDLQKVYLQTNDFSGGVNYPVFANDKLYFSAKKIEHDELEMIPVEKVSFKEVDISEIKMKEINQKENPFMLDSVPEIENKNLFGEYNVKKYSPLKYLIQLSTVPFMTIKDISADESPSLLPGLGVTLKTQADPFMNNSAVFSAAWKYFDFKYTWSTNAPTEQEKDIEQEKLNKQKDKSMTLFFENSSTPIDIKGGAIFRCNLDGEYDFKAVFGTNWQVPLGMSFVRLNFKVDGYYSASTDYYDSNLIGKYESLSGWPGFGDAYNLFYASTTASFSNIHQYGISKYQNLGVAFGIRLYSMWDIYEIALLNEAKQNKQSESGLTQAQQQSLDDSYKIDMTQLNVGLFATLALPALIPVRMYNGWVVSLPTTFNLEFMPKAGTALSFNTESLLIGKELNQGIPFLYLFFNRFGLKTGFNVDVNYDTTVIRLPDIRNDKYFDELLSNSYFQGSIYLLFDMSNTIPMGILSDKIINSQFKATYYPDTKGFTFSFLFDMRF